MLIHDAADLSYDDTGDTLDRDDARRYADTESIPFVGGANSLHRFTRDESENHGSDCVFCAYADPAGNDRDARVVARSQHAYTLVSRAPGHVLVRPCEHVGEYVCSTDQR